MTSYADETQIARILDNDLASGLYDEATEWDYSQLLARLRAAIENPNKGMDSQ